MNFGSYNYLGFAEKEGPCKDAVEEVTTEYGLSSMGSRQELGKKPLFFAQLKWWVHLLTRLHLQLTADWGVGGGGCKF